MHWLIESAVEAARKSPGQQRLTALIVAAGCILQPLSVDRKGAQKTLEQSGYTHIQTSSKIQWWACPDFNLMRTGFTATNPRGNIMNGVVCSGPRSPSINIKPSP
jgi:hypothetical protein